MGKLRKLNLYCVDTIGGGGTEVWVRSLIKSLAKEYKVRLISGSLEPEISEYVSTFVKLHLPSKPGFFRVFSYAIFSSFVPGSNADVLHVVGAITFRKSHLNTIHFYHRENFRLRKTSIYKSDSMFRVLNRLIYTIMCLCMERLIFTEFFSRKLASVSPEMCALLEKDFDRNVHLTHNGINPEEIGRVQVEIVEPYLLFVGGDWERKGLADVIDSVSLIKPIYPSIKLFVAGSGNIESYSLQSQRLGLTENIFWLGRVPRSEIPYCEKSIILCASTFEVSPLIFLEAAMCGAPVISYPVFGTREAVEDGYLRICNPSPNGIATEVVRLLGDEKAMLSMSRKGIRLRETKKWDLTVQETLDLYPD